MAQEVTVEDIIVCHNIPYSGIKQLGWFVQFAFGCGLKFPCLGLLLTQEQHGMACAVLQS